jgi:predicted DNA-binding protein with PD1-like motif
MIVFEPNRTRRIVGRLERGESVLDALAEVALHRGISSAWFQATGPLESAELAVFDVETRRYSLPKRVGACTAVQITGNLSRLGGLPFAHAHALVAPARPDGAEGAAAGVAIPATVGALLGGELRAGIAFAVEFVIEAYDDLVLERFPDDATGLPLWRGKATAAVAASPAQLGWAAAAAEAERFAAQPTPARAPRTPHMPPERVVEPAFAAQPIPDKKRVVDTEEDEPILAQGDWVAHKQFGLCHVDGEDSEGAVIIRLPSGVRKVIRLDFLRVLPCHVQDDRRIFPLEQRKK